MRNWVKIYKVIMVTAAIALLSWGIYITLFTKTRLTIKKEIQFK